LRDHQSDVRFIIFEKEMGMSYIKIFLFGLLLCVLSMSGCSSNTSSSSGFASGSGFSINLTATQTILAQGGSTTLIAAVKDAQGNPVNDSATNAVTFTSSLGATITQQNNGNIIGGISSAIYGAPGSSSSGSTGTTTTSTTGVDQVTASYRGAVAFVSIFVFKP
jgi:hypothetical protein